MTLRSAPVKTLLGVLAAVGLMLSACNGSATSKATTTTSTTSTTANGDVGPVGVSDLAAKLLSARDLPPGFTQTSDDATSVDNSIGKGQPKSFCGRAAAFSGEYAPVHEMHRDFQREATGAASPTVLIADIELYPTPATALGAMRAFVGSMTKCATASSGQSPIVAEPIPSFPTLGAATYAARITPTHTSSTVAPVGGDLVAVCSDQFIVIVFAIGPAAPALAFTELVEVARAAAAKI